MKNHPRRGCDDLGLPGTVQVAALLVRRVARYVLQTGRYLAVAGLRVRWEPGLRAYRIFLWCRAGGAGERCGADERGGADGPGFGDPVGPVGPVVQLLNPPSPPPVLLRDMRVRRLQEKAARVLLAREFGVTVAGSEVAVLGTFSSLPWLRGNLLAAAGCDAVRRIHRHELRERCRVVYPVFIRAMTMHRQILESGIAPPPGELQGRQISRRVRRWQRKYGVGREGEILDSCYPRAIPEAKRRLRRYQQREETRRIYRRERAAHDLVRFARYLEAITLVSKAGVRRPARAARTLVALHRVYQQSTAGGTRWQRGAGNRKTWI